MTKMNLKSSDQTKLQRKQLQAQRKGFIDTVEQKEGFIYGAGGF